MRRVAALLFCLLLCARCSEPPQKEIDRAQGAIDAARAAGADQYAAPEFAEATTALQQSHEAVGQRDYRLALSRALDASQRAQESARQAVDGQAKARSDAELAIQATVTALEQLESKLAAAASARAPDAELKPGQRTVSDVQRALQNARLALAAGKFREARTSVKTIETQIAEQIQALDDGARGRGAKRRR